VALIGPGNFDTILTNIVGQLKTVATEQRNLDATKGWTTFRNATRPWEAKQLATEPIVNAWMPRLDPVDEGSTSRTVNSMQATYNIDLYVRGIETAGVQPADEEALDRLYLLAQQTMHALYALAFANWGLAVGEIQDQSWPRYETLQTDEKKIEDMIIAGRWSLSITYAWEAEDITPADLTKITITETKRFGAEYTYPAP